MSHLKKKNPFINFVGKLFYLFDFFFFNWRQGIDKTMFHLSAQLKGRGSEVLCYHVKSVTFLVPALEQVIQLKIQRTEKGQKNLTLTA